MEGSGEEIYNLAEEKDFRQICKYNLPYYQISKVDVNESLVEIWDSSVQGFVTHRDMFAPGCHVVCTRVSCRPLSRLYISSDFVGTEGQTLNISRCMLALRQVLCLFAWNCKTIYRERMK